MEAGSASFWNRRAGCFADIPLATAEDALMRSISEESERWGRVLDIGCGTGRYAIPLSRMSESVTGLDISPEMVDIARARASSEGRDNIRFDVCDWMSEEPDWLDESYDLVVASMTPAICSDVSFRRMLSYVGGSCRIVLAAHQTSNVGAAMESEGIPVSGRSNDLAAGLKILWDSGIRPTLEYDDVSICQSESEEDLVTRFSQLSNGEHNDRIRDVIGSMSESGIVLFKGVTTRAIVSFSL